MWIRRHGHNDGYRVLHRFPLSANSKLDSSFSFRAGNQFSVHVQRFSRPEKWIYGIPLVVLLLFDSLLAIKRGRRRRKTGWGIGSLDEWLAICHTDAFHPSGGGRHHGDSIHPDSPDLA